MKADEIISKVMKRAEIGSRVEAKNAIQATVETLSEHLTAEECQNLSAQLPPEIADSMRSSRPGGEAERFSLDEFFQRVSQREDVGLQEATRHTRVVCAVLAEAITIGQLDHLKAQLPNDIARLFDVQNEGEIPEL
ncbi:uncharacterized protein (DUF2267 family) [Thermosporothrix hazakensis]|uniref:Uncharacterized protein (DUF2267 family) n=2 Tax=Thermosporothrix TaxID=768650 RepID=A0A326U8D3_THEHA|nr:DUF2267 domain-containing protein [Thermosporothrix hazakensis]PZW30505.1 uncharacterized protein (DUF2267 family) [Thermosporothrix hazakensis]BBH91219.1 hypothetical protein KTC_59700 [Thermosporothrix sp. COM3]GCE49365.1 hypothetical protein KTH_42340 [Thermosporothrix hazakensis]